MKILLFAFQFPPLATAGVHRPRRLAKYLPEFGIQPVVITTDRESFRRTMNSQPFDDSLLSDLPQTLEIERFSCGPAAAHRGGKLGKAFHIYFSVIGERFDQWRRQVGAALPSLVGKYNPKAIVVTMPPFSMAEFGCAIANRLEIPLLFDFRDPWSQWQVGPYRSWLHYRLTLRAEKRYLARADRVVCTSDQTRTDFLRIHPELPAGKISVVTNGYDAEIVDWTSGGPTRATLFTIGYVGSFYYIPGAREAMLRPWWKKSGYRMVQYVPRKEDWLYRSPYFFFQAVAELLCKHPECRRRLQIRFAGRKPDWIEAQAQHFGLGELIEFVGHLDHSDALRFQRDCDALLVTSSKVLSGRDYSISSKTFEYFAMQKPILGFVTEGAQKDLLEKSGVALICDPDLPKESVDKLFELMEGRIRFRPNREFLESLNCRNLAGKFAAIVSEMIQEHEVTQLTCE